MQQPDSPLDTLIDMLRSRSMLFLLAGLVAGWLFFASPDQPNHLYLDIINTDTILINSVKLDFGYALNQSSLLTLQINPAEQRSLVLNHPPGKGFNVEVRYNDGQMQSFCANRNLTAQRQHLKLHR